MPRWQTVFLRDPLSASHDKDQIAAYLLLVGFASQGTQFKVYLEGTTIITIEAVINL